MSDSFFEKKVRVRIILKIIPTAAIFFKESIKKAFQCPSDHFEKMKTDMWDSIALNYLMTNSKWIKLYFMSFLRYKLY